MTKKINHSVIPSTYPYPRKRIKNNKSIVNLPLPNKLSPYNINLLILQEIYTDLTPTENHKERQVITFESTREPQVNRASRESREHAYPLIFKHLFVSKADDTVGFYTLLLFPPISSSHFHSLS